MAKLKGVISLVLLVNLLNVECYNYGGHRQTSGEEQSDIGMPQHTPVFLKNEKYANAYGVKTGGVKTFTKTNYNQGRASAAFSSHEQSGEMLYNGGCRGIPSTPMNTFMRCTSHAGCLIKCNADYQFPNGATSVALQCVGQQWVVQGTGETDVAPCQPICLPQCMNNGICISPGECNCPENFSGPQCQYEKKPCLNYPPLPMNARRSCTSTTCSISCMDGHKFPDGSSITNLICKEGSWVLTRQDLAAVPDCLPVCHPPCLNGGSCLSLNVCQCPQDFRGAQCQYSASACSHEKLGFNGGFQCSGNAETFSCVLSCPAGIKFDFPPQPKYTCSYATGYFQPQPVPKCIYGNAQVFTMGGSSQTFYKTKTSKTMGDFTQGSGETWTSHKTGGTYGAYDGYSITNGSSLKKLSDLYGSQQRITLRRPAPGNCVTWGGAHFKTFDGKVYSFKSSCRYILARDSRDGAFSIIVQNVGNQRAISVFLQDKEYTLEAAADGAMVFKSAKRLLPIPAQLPGLRVQMAGHMVQLSMENLGLKLKWNGKQYIQVSVTESLWNRTEGLCGRIDGNPDNDFLTKDGYIPQSVTTLADSWKVNKVGESACEDKPSDKHACTKVSIEINQKAQKFCNDLVAKKRFAACSKLMDISLLLDACKWDYCDCPKNQGREECGCESMSVYASQCVAEGVTSLEKWRDEETCMMNCTGGRVYSPCGPGIQAACGSPSVPQHHQHAQRGDQPVSSEVADAGGACVEGCYCPPGTLLHGEHCVTLDMCPCRLRGKQFPPGSSVPKDCNTCTCQNGEWTCTQVSCGARCSAIGDPHYQTFDGKRFDFMGQCTYHLLKGDDYSIQAENVACSGAISDAMNIPSTRNSWEIPSCTKTVTVQYGKTVLQLKQGRAVTVDGRDVNSLPVRVNGIKIRALSSLFVLVELPNKIQIWWDGVTRAYIDAPSSFRGKTKGLCGTFNSNQKDDFLTPEGDIEQAVIPFANKWKTGERCEDLPNHQATHPCQLNQHNKATAERLCATLKSKLFEDCHWSVEVDSFYEDCLFDMCSCEAPVERCLCPIIGSYASECASQGVFIQWRYNVKECEVHCPGTQTYQVCGDSCARSCPDLMLAAEDMADQAEEAHCRPRCVEGCNCPPGQALGEHGECLPRAECPCQHAGLVFPPRYKEVRPGRKQMELCVCAGARWDCQPASDEDILKFPRASDIKDKCSAANHEEFTTCEPVEPITCKNIHSPPAGSSAAECRPGCRCMHGYVWDSIAKKCIKPEDCPCHHGGRSYADGHTMQEDCNTCTCNGGKWTCTERPCAGVCSAWGDSHFRSFDGRELDFQGVCSYLLTKGCLDSPDDDFSVEIQNEVCGTSGETCSKAVTLKVGAGKSMETVTFAKDKPLPNVKNLKRIKLRHVGMFIFADVPSLDIVLQWDKGTRVYVRADPKWKGRLKGLCGNYNGNEADDFQTPSGGVTEASAKLFGDSWKMQPNCPPAQDVQDTCALHPERRAWSVEKCGILKRAPFSACHAEVPVDEHVKRCERDACACGTGGDCECLCTALAAYAHRCAARGVPVKWRTPEICPMQCDETCTSYSPCMSPCPVETCNNALHYKKITEMCVHDTCIEGCESKKKCPPDFVSVKPINGSEADCVARASCKPECMVLPGGKVVLEGEVIEQDDCHACHCSRSKKICTGQPCSTTIPVPVTERSMMEQKTKCTPGWSPWMSNTVPQSTKDAKATKTSKPYSLEFEPIPTVLEMNKLGGAVCLPDKMVDIECRTVVGKKSAKETGLEAECSLERGLACRQPSAKPCPDFEIRVKCACGPEPTTKLPDVEILFTSPEKKQSYVVSSTKPPPVLQCDSSRPNQPHPSDCFLFYQCAPGMGPKEHPDLVEKTCGPHMMYNPYSMICDWPEAVKKVKPECGVIAATEHPLIDTTVITFKEEVHAKPMCEEGKVWSTCALPCNHVCLYYGFYLKTERKCPVGKECVPGCVDKKVAAISCGPGHLWRDSKTCVPVKDCTCRSHEGKPVKPGQVIKESACEFCQCLNNQYTCDRSSCITKEPPKPTIKSVQPTTLPPKIVTKIVVELERSPKTGKVVTQGNQTKTVEIIDEYNSMVGIIRPTTVSPPPECNPERYTNVLWDDELPMGDQAFSASSSLGASFEPKNAKLNGKVTETSGGSWTPQDSNPDQYIQVQLPRKQPLYGIYMQGSPIFDQYVTSYKVLYGDDGHSFSYVNGPDGKPQIFRGNYDSKTPIKQMFPSPFEARYVRVNPVTWYDLISVRMELIGCGKVVTTKSLVVTTTPTPVFETFVTSVPKKSITVTKCMPPKKLMDLPVGVLTFSSRKPQDTATTIKTNQPKAWQPLTNSPGEWVQFDLIAPQNITGVTTKGGPAGWVTSYILKYSGDGDDWNPIMDTATYQPRIFPGNFDSDSPVSNSFDIPVRAKYLKVLPSTWKDNMQMRVSPQGCAQEKKQSIIQQEIPYNNYTIGPEIVKPVNCEICPGLVPPFKDCRCVAPKAFDGHECVPRIQCPCYVGHIPYTVGATYETEDCEVCTCKLGGVPHCNKKDCPKCQTGLVRSLSELCSCDCVPCPVGKRACPTSGTCVPISSWCDGVRDCPDDEVDCVVTTTPPTTTEIAKVECPVPTCPVGYKVVEKKPAAYTRLELQEEGQVAPDSLFATKKSYMKYYKGGTKTGSRAASKTGVKSSYQSEASLPRKTLARPVKASEKPAECAVWRCVSARPPPALVPLRGLKPTLPPCPAPHCPTDYTITMEGGELDEYDCPKYTCTPPARRDVVCNVTSRTFNTFDSTEYQYDICNHILARDADGGTWDVTIQKNCTKHLCVHELVISQGGDQVRLRPDLTLEYNGYHYTVDQTKKIGFQMQTFVVSRLGNSLFYISTKCGFWVIYDSKGNVKVGVAGKLYGHVDGLCGFYNGDPKDDRRKPDGSQALSIEEFGDSWAHTDSPEVCEAKACPIHLQDQAWEICKAISSPTFSSCKSVMNLDKSRSACLESVCECLQADASSRKSSGGKGRPSGQGCLCQALQGFVTDCQAADQGVNLQGWRTDMNCPAVCPAPLVHYDCFRRSCELSCSSLREESPCPATPGVCFSGCFCPEGTVRRGQACVPPTECRDCVCDGFGKPEYVTFDRRNFTFNGNCTYIAAKDKTPGKEKPAFEVYVTNGECPKDPDSICTVAVHIIIDNHVMHIQKNGDEMETTIDGALVQHYPLENKWIKLQEMCGKDINLLIPALQLEVTSIFHNMAFTVRVPSMLYGGKLEGLCGDCDGDPDNDLMPSDEPRKHGLAWRAPSKSLDKLELHEDTCAEKPKNECWPLPPDQDPCFKIMDQFKFGKCHPVIDPVPYVSSCQQDLCSVSKQLGACGSIEAYARQCAAAGICVDWRRPDFCPYKCERDMIYKSCGLGCQITCDNYAKYANKSSLCTLPRSEGCFCPEGKVLVNGTCIPHSKCFPCDSAGHYLGDSWQVDECTTCSCPPRGGVACVQRSCATASVCSPGLQAQQLAKKQGECCAEFVCVPMPTDRPQCEEPVKMNCGFGQVMKLETMADSCPKFVCQCKPMDECDPIFNSTADVEVLPAGMQKVVDSSGCCPKANLVCKPELCPAPLPCPKYHLPKKAATAGKGQCCPTYTCEPPADKCLYDMEYESSPLGGEKKRESTHIETIPKMVSETWQDGPCRSCECKKIGGKPTGVKTKTKTSAAVRPILRAVCSVMQCSPVSQSEEFVIEPVGVPFSCCPEAKYTACKHQGQIYKVGEEWKSNTNPCESYLCSAKEDGTLERKTNVKQCEQKCKKGFKYAASKDPSKICCGECMAVACIFKGTEKKIGEEWTSDDHCTNYFCLNKNGTLQVQVVTVNCPEVSKGLRDEFLIEEVVIPGKCCKDVKAVACKVQDKIYKVGDEWPSSTNSCISYKCAMKKDGTLEKMTSVKQCDAKCKIGFKYVVGKECCGKCVAIACVVNGKEKKIGEKWSSEDFCTNFVCQDRNGSLLVQAVKVSCPAITKNMREEYEMEEIPVHGECCNKVKPVACKVNGTIYKVGTEWKSPTDPCKSFVCSAKTDGSLEKRTNVKQCITKCKQGWIYKPAPPASKLCCGECVPVACVVHGIERKIGEEWTSDDHCTNYFCLNKNGTLQVQSMGVSCPEVPERLRQEMELLETPVEGQCCKRVETVGCKVNGEIYREGSTWRSPDGDPCKNVSCVREAGGQLGKVESSETCREECQRGWEYRPAQDKRQCCGSCQQTHCCVGDDLYKADEVWMSPDNCTRFLCSAQADGQLVVAAQKESCPDVSTCAPDHLYKKGCCYHCNVTSEAQKMCVSQSKPLSQTLGLVHQLKPPHGNCVNKQPLQGFRECKGSCQSGTSYNEGSFTQDTACQCCQAIKYDGLIVDLTCEDGFTFKKQVAVPSECDCQACQGELVSRPSKTFTKTSPARRPMGVKTGYRSQFSEEANPNDDVEMINPALVS